MLWKRVLVMLLALPVLACAGPAASVWTQEPRGETSELFRRPWRWTDDAGRDVALADFRGRPLILTAIYTSCTERCPLTVDKLRRVDEAFRRHHVDDRVVLVTLDPEHDTVDRLRRFKMDRAMPSQWHLLRGDLVGTHEVARLLRMSAIYDDGHIDHDVRIAVYDGDGRLVRSFEGWAFDENDAVVAR